MNEPAATADELFQAALDSRGLPWSLGDDGLYSVALGDIQTTVSLENVRRNYERDGDPDAVTRFARQLSGEFFNNVPAWDEVRPFVRFCLEPDEYDDLFRDTLHEAVGAGLVKVFVYVPTDGSRISWITQDLVQDWKVSSDDVIAAAEENMNRLASETAVLSQDIDGVPLGMLNTTETPFKASLVVAGAFRSIVEPSHGWPVFVVVPARDFVYVIPGDRRDFLPRLGPVVVREYNESGHPITQEVLRIGDDGVTAVGSFASGD